MNRHFWYYCLTASVILVIAATLAPFNFVIPEYIISQSLIFEEFRYSSTVKDYWQNILLFLPFGISLAAVLSTTKLKSAIVLIPAILASCTLSLLVESLQLFLPIRVSNFSDVATNTIGGFLGTSLYWWRNSIVSLARAILGENSKRRLKSLITVFVCYFFAIYLATYVILININLRNWNDDFYLVIGNEATGDRPWQGYIKSFQISDRPLSFSEIEKAFSERQLPVNRADYIVSYQFEDQRESYISLGDSANVLVWQENSSSNTDNSRSDQTEVDRNSILVNGDRWLISPTPASKLIDELKTADRFTLSIILATDRTQQIGPARIISLSKDIVSRNFTIGQEQSNLTFRLRSPITGDNASQPELVIPEVFNDTNFHHLLITFARNQLNFYIDRESNKYSFLFQPEINFLAYYPLAISNWQINLADFAPLKYYLAFYGIAFIPLGLIGGFILSLIRNNSLVKILSIVIICFVPPILLELLYASMTSQPFRKSNLLLATLMLLTTALIVNKEKLNYAN